MPDMPTVAIQVSMSAEQIYNLSKRRTARRLMKRALEQAGGSGIRFERPYPLNGRWYQRAFGTRASA